MKFLVVGLGSIGMRHAKNLIAMGHEVCGYDLLKNEDEYEIPKDYIDETDADGVLICTPTDSHYDDLVDAVENDKHIFIEKPLAHYSQIVTGGLPELLDEAKRKNLIVMVGNMLRFHPNVIMAKSLIKNPEVASFRVLQKNNKPTYKRDGVLLNWGSHEFDLALYLLGPATVIDAKVEENVAVVTLKHDEGATSSISMDYLTEPEVREFAITEEDGTTHEVNLTLHDWNPIYMAEMQAFVDMIQAVTPKPDDELNESTMSEMIRGAQAHKIAATGEDGLATLRLIEKAKEMARLS